MPCGRFWFAIDCKVEKDNTSPNSEFPISTFSYVHFWAPSSCGPVELNVHEINRISLRLNHKQMQTLQGRTGYSGNETLVAMAFSMFHTKYQKIGLLEEFWGPFGFFCMECRRDLLISVHLWKPEASNLIGKTTCGGHKYPT
jgi:hypothetical protein